MTYSQLFCWWNHGNHGQHMENNNNNNNEGWEFPSGGRSESQLKYRSLDTIQSFKTLPGSHFLVCSKFSVFIKWRKAGIHYAKSKQRSNLILSLLSLHYAISKMCLQWYLELARKLVSATPRYLSCLSSICYL